MKWKQYITLAFLFFLMACEKQSSNTPPANRNDRTMECKLNGEKWKAGDGTIIAEGHTQVYLLGDSGIAIYGRNKLNNTLISISLYDTAGLKNGVYQLNTGRNSGLFLDNNKSSNNYYRTDTANYVGTCSIVIDYPNKVVSGTFEFNAKADSTQDEVDIAEGYYSIVYNKY